MLLDIVYRAQGPWEAESFDSIEAGFVSGIIVKLGEIDLGEPVESKSVGSLAYLQTGKSISACLRHVRASLGTSRLDHALSIKIMRASRRRRWSPARADGGVRIPGLHRSSSRNCVMLVGAIAKSKILRRI